jgi:hypothetical protein
MGHNLDGIKPSFISIVNYYEIFFLEEITYAFSVEVSSRLPTFISL